MAKSVAYPITADGTLPKTHWTIRSFWDKDESSKTIIKSQELTMEDMEVVAALNDAARDMAFIHSCFDHITEDILIDCLIYELKAVSLRHKYFLDMCKQKGIVSGSPAS